VRLSTSTLPQIQPQQVLGESLPTVLVLLVQMPLRWLDTVFWLLVRRSIKANQLRRFHLTTQRLTTDRSNTYVWTGGAGTLTLTVRLYAGRQLVYVLA
jgi:hypothetical protein